ncbi:substrate-binding domain-containing protein [Nonomuraea sp. K274]|uniref:Substrate-binding domain-containing protein n=1 Tax=Nonomuraea cypriaca TaxID=1187855 RepID=A0A931AAK1_9ACTN|nr:substrate-binding domain-containing protein [Nonomuraea cypriaca]MBF8189402.1 substrate-binding domain-containing protein [Nonomuraea cypriaca]
MAVRLFSTLAVKKALDDVLLEAFERETGIEIDGVYDPTTQLLLRIENGERPDVMIAVTSSFEELRGSGVVDVGTRVPVARTGVGLAVPPDTDLPDVSTFEAFKKTLLDARSVAYSRTGASGIYFARLIQDLGIADEINARATVIDKGFIALAVVDGRADIAIQQLSELRFVPEARIAGPFPDDVQHYTEFSAALGVGSTDEAKAFVDFLTSDTARAAYEQTGLEMP